MSIQSMTGFGKGQFQNERHSLLIEIKSVNNRFIETRFRMPGEFNELEIKLRKNIGDFFKRGTFDVYIQYKSFQDKLADRLDKVKIQNVINEFLEITENLNVKLQISAGDFLKPEFFQSSELGSSEQPELFGLLNETFENALKNLYESRVCEGQKLVEIIDDHLKKLKELFFKIGPLEGNYQLMVESRLKAQFLNFKPELRPDENRFNQELIYYLEKLDIKEEINRIKGHITEFEKIIGTRGEVGRRLDFLIQELHREINTLGAKSGLKEISDIVLEMKIEMEKIREQVANLE